MYAYAALSDRLLVIDRQRRSHCAQTTDWETLETLDGQQIESLAASPERPERVFVGTVEAGIQCSVDGGKTFERVSDIDDRITALSVSPHDPDEVWAGTEPSAVYRSTDGGTNWQSCAPLDELDTAERWSFPPRPHTHHVRWLAHHPEQPDTVYVAIEAGAFIKTTDAGTSWIDHPAGGRLDNHTLATHQAAPKRVYTAAGDGYAESPDAGTTWTYPQDGLEHGYVWGLAVGPEDPDTVVVSAADSARRAHRAETAESYIYRREGEEWTVAMGGLPDPDGSTRAVLESGSTPGELLLLNNHGLFRTLDGASSWRRLPVEWDGNVLARGLVVLE